MRRSGKIALLLALLVWGLATVAGCGGGGEAAESTTAKQERLYPWLKGPSREFLIRGGDNLVQTFGREATDAEREQASRVIEAWMKARAAQNWRKDCSYFSRQYAHDLVWKDAHQSSYGKVNSCPEALAWFGHAASGSYKNNLTGPIDSLRVQHDQGFAQYHGNDGHDWILAMQKEHGEWLVAHSTPIGRSS
jgi:hypothetical protein